MTAPYNKNNTQYWTEWNERIREEVKGSMNNSVPAPNSPYPGEKLSEDYVFQYVNNKSGKESKEGEKE